MRATLPSVRRVFRAIAVTVVPEARELDSHGWSEMEAIVEGALADRPERLRRQLKLLLVALEWLPFLRHGRRFSGLDPASRADILLRVQHSPALLLRRGFWGLRSLILMGYYARPEARRRIGYRASPAGWGARPASGPERS